MFKEKIHTTLINIDKAVEPCSGRVFPIGQWLLSQRLSTYWSFGQNIIDILLRFCSRRVRRPS